MGNRQTPFGGANVLRNVIKIRGRVTTADEESLEHVEAAGLTEEGYMEFNSTELIRCSNCSRVLSTPEHLYALDSDTNQVLCETCTRVCSHPRCQRIVGPANSMEIFGSLYCREHGTEVFRSWLLGGIVLVVAVAILIVVVVLL